MVGPAELVLIGILATVFLVLVPLMTLAFLRRLSARAIDEVRAMGTPRLMDHRASTGGVLSRGVTQARGNGCLAAFEDELVFVQWVPKRTLRIPRSSIVAVQRRDSFLGKRRFGFPLLEVSWKGEQGEDAAGFWVVDLPAWERELGAS